MEIGIPLTPKNVKQIDPEFKDDTIIVDFFPILEIVSLKIGDKTVSDSEYVLAEDEGIIYLEKVMEGLLYMEYSYGLSEDQYMGLLDMMVEYEKDTNPYANATSIRENNVSVSYDSSTTEGAIIQSLIDTLRNRYNCTVRMI